MTRLPDKATSRAVLIASSNYASVELPDIASVRASTTALLAALTDPSVGAFSGDHCLLVADPDDYRTLYRSIKAAAREATDTLLVYFCGHGRVGRDRNDLYLCTADTDPDELSISALAIAQLRDVLLDSRAANKVLLLDCCFSGRAISDLSGQAVPAAVVATDIQGTYILTATAANEVALAPEGEAHTAFTGALLAMLTAGDPASGPLITLDDLYRGMRARLAAANRPLPQRSGSNTSPNLALALNRAAPSAGRRGSGASVSPEDLYVLISEEEIRAKVAELAAAIGEFYAGKAQNLLVVCLLPGGLHFFEDLTASLTFSPRLGFLQVAARDDGEHFVLKDVHADMAGRDVLLVDNYQDTGERLAWTVEAVRAKGAASIEVAVLVRNIEALAVCQEHIFVGFDVPNEPLVGYSFTTGGGDWHLPFIGFVKPQSRD